MWCQDPFLSLLKRHQYLPVTMPRARIEPRLLITGEPKRLYEIGDLTQVVSAEGVEPPTIRRDDRVAELEGLVTNTVDAGLGGAIAARLATALGLDAAEVKSKLDRRKKMAFRFSSVLEDSIALADLDRFLTSGTPVLSESYAGTLLLESHLYVIVSTIKSATFGVLLGEGSEHQHGAEIASGGIGSVKATIASVDAREGQVTFNGASPIVFGVRAVRLFYSEGRFTRWRAIDSGKAALRSFSRNETDPDAEYLTEAVDGFAHLADVTD